MLAQTERSTIHNVIEKDEEYIIEKDEKNPQSEVLIPYDPVKR